MLERGRKTNNATKEIIESKSDIHKAMQIFANNPQLNSTEIPIPIITLKIRAITLLQEFCLHILTILSIKLGIFLPANIICTK